VVGFVIGAGLMIGAGALLAFGAAHMQGYTVDAAGAPVPGDGAAAEAAGADTSKIYTDLTDDQAKRHILEGDETGGGHRYGIGKPGKSEFPASWSDEKILGEISDVATDPAADRRVDPKDGRTIVEGTRDGIRIRVIIENPRVGERIVTGYPTNLQRNPR
jgi:hypothetical protein